MIAGAIQIAAAAGLGGMAGLLGGLFGVGGGFLVIPLLGFFYGMDQQTAQGTALIMVVPNVLWAFSRYQRRFGVDLRRSSESEVLDHQILAQHALAPIIILINSQNIYEIRYCLGSFHLLADYP
jgi:hypothetical protein